MIWRKPLLAKSNKEKKAEKRALDASKGFKPMTFVAGPATQANLAKLMERYHFEDWRELVTRLIDATAEGQLADVIPMPQHEFKPSQKVLRTLYWLGKSEVDPDEH